MKRLSLILAFVASTASANTQVSDLTDCYYNDGLRSLGLDPNNIPSAMQSMANDLRITLFETAQTAVGFMQQYDDLELVNAATRLGTSGEPELQRVFISCNNRVLGQ